MDLSHLSLEELNKLSQQIHSAIAERRKAAEGALLVEIQKKAALLGLSMNELRDRLAGSGRAKGKSTIRYRHPETGAEWSGRGRKPQWYLAWLESGRLEDELKVN